MQKQKILLKENINLLSWDFNSNHLNNARSTNHFYLMTISVSLKFVANEHVYIICLLVCCAVLPQGQVFVFCD